MIARLARVDAVERLAELAVRFGANVQPGQVVGVKCEVGHLEVVRAVAEAAYRGGARFVDVEIDDPELVRSRVRCGPVEGLAYLPRWPESRLRELDEERGANIKIVGPTAPGLFDDLDPARVAAAMGPRSRAWREVEYRMNSTIIPGPNLAWARSLRPALEPVEALEALSADIVVACRLDLPDPPQAWRDRFAQLAARADKLSALRLDRVRLSGPGTELVVGLLASARWDHAGHITERGIEHAWNLPSEEVDAVPDRDRVDGHVRLTRPAVVGGRQVDGVSISFRAGRAVEVCGADGVQALREYIARDEGAGRLGQLALVDSSSRVGTLRRTFGVILLDENTATHLALGFGFPDLVDTSERDRVNDSDTHLDVMIGSEQLEATGIDRDGQELPLLRAGTWAL